MKINKKNICKRNFKFSFFQRIRGSVIIVHFFLYHSYIKNIEINRSCFEQMFLLEILQNLIKILINLAIFVHIFHFGVITEFVCKW